MSKLQQSDLILAGRYVDGDLPAHEIASVESRIDSDAEFSAAVENIRSQSSAIGKLPMFIPSDDLADRTLQASMDQVRAIMGAWPLEEESKPAPKSEMPLGNSDWKSTIALIASLAGVIMFGMILWQNNNAGDSSVAVNTVEKSSVERAADDGMPSAKSTAIPESVSPGKSADAMRPKTSDLTVGIDESQIVDAPPGGFGGGGGGFGGGGFMGTPTIKPPAQNSFVNNQNPSNVAQIWCVNPDQSVPKNSVCEILLSNEIEVQLEEKNQLATSNAFDAYYVAATPSQMKQVLTEISNKANIEMFPIPQGSNSAFADAVEKQFQQSNIGVGEQVAVDNETANPNAPQNFELAQSNALAQQLVVNSVPKAQPPMDPPPILDSGSLNRDLSPKEPNVAMKRSQDARSKAKGSARQVESAASPADGSIVQQKIGPPGGIVANKPIPESHGKIDKLIDGTDERLQQYLILVHADENPNR